MTMKDDNFKVKFTRNFMTNPCKPLFGEHNGSVGHDDAKRYSR